MFTKRLLGMLSILAYLVLGSSSFASTLCISCYPLSSSCTVATQVCDTSTCPANSYASQGACNSALTASSPSSTSTGMDSTALDSQYN